MATTSELPPQIPQSYGRRNRSSSDASSSSSSSSSSSMSPRPAITDADDSIVLSDLLRTGEASRLRRRGAMRLDRHSITNAHPFNPDLEDSGNDEGFSPFRSLYIHDDTRRGDALQRSHRTFSAHQHQYPSYSRWLEHSGHDPEPESMSYILVCGAEIEDPSLQHHYDDSHAFEPSPLPLSPKISRPGSQHSEHKPVSNGCGAIIHLYASASDCSAHHTHRTYVARTQATNAVVSLPAEYFHSWVGMKFETSECGCVKEGIGCAVCGNALGTRWRFCPKMTEGRQKTSTRGVPRQGPLRPEGPRYWNGTPSRSPSRTRVSDPIASSSEDIVATPCPTSPTSPRSPPSLISTEEEFSSPMELYTFFANSVTAYPDPIYSPQKRPALPDADSPLSSPRFAPSSPRTRMSIWRSSGSFSSEESTSSEDDAGRASFDSSMDQGQEVNIDFGMSRFYSESGLPPPRPSSMPNIITSHLDHSPQVPVFDRQFTSSPEPSSPEVRLTAPAFSFENGSRTLAPPVGYWGWTTSSFTLDEDGGDEHVGSPTQPLSFYQQQILGASEREMRDEQRSPPRWTNPWRHNSVESDAAFDLALRNIYPGHEEEDKEESVVESPSDTPQDLFFDR